jgi:hypothetical protein
MHFQVSIGLFKFAISINLRKLDNKKGAKAPVIPFKNKNNNTGQFSLTHSFSLTGEEGVRILLTGQIQRERRGREREYAESAGVLSAFLIQSVSMRADYRIGSTLGLR